MVQFDPSLRYRICVRSLPNPPNLLAVACVHVCIASLAMVDVAMLLWDDVMGFRSGCLIFISSFIKFVSGLYLHISACVIFSPQSESATSRRGSFNQGQSIGLNILFCNLLFLFPKCQTAASHSARY